MGIRRLTTPLARSIATAGVSHRSFLLVVPLSSIELASHELVGVLVAVVRSAVERTRSAKGFNHGGNGHVAPVHDLMSVPPTARLCYPVVGAIRARLLSTDIYVEDPGKAGLERLVHDGTASRIASNVAPTECVYFPVAVNTVCPVACAKSAGSTPAARINDT